MKSVSHIVDQPRSKQKSLNKILSPKTRITSLFRLDYFRIIYPVIIVAFSNGILVAIKGIEGVIKNGATLIDYLMLSLLCVVFPSIVVWLTLKLFYARTLYLSKEGIYYGRTLILWKNIH